MEESRGQKARSHIIQHHAETSWSPFEPADRRRFQNIKDPKKDKSQTASRKCMGSCQKCYSLPEPFIDHHTGRVGKTGLPDSPPGSDSSQNPEGEEKGQKPPGGYGGQDKPEDSARQARVGAGSPGDESHAPGRIDPFPERGSVTQ